MIVSEPTCMLKRVKYIGALESDGVRFAATW
jgi:hypothetical protein